MLRKFFNLAIIIGIITVLAGIGWKAYGEFNISDAAQFDASITMVNHQTERISESFDTTRAFVATGIEQINDLSALIEEWTPRYTQAQIAYRRFDAAIVAAEDRADAYFAAQRALTEGYDSEESRARAEAEDNADFELYRQWRERAHDVRGEALGIMNRLGDLDTDLQKLKLRSEFSFDAGAFSEVPTEIISLGDELEQFQVASENIRKITGSPFDPNRSN